MHVVGMMWNKNEGDILEETIIAALPRVDSLFIADDGSTDRSWSIIQAMQAFDSRIEHIQQKPNKNDPAQRQSLLDEIRRRYKPEDTWVQVIESDIMILDTDVRWAIENYADSHNLAVSWQALNAVRDPGTWSEVDTYPNWGPLITEIMPKAHFMETMTYTFRPLPGLNYQPGRWRPWPSGWTKYSKDPVMNKGRRPDSPLLAHYGYRGPTHFYKKYQSMGAHHKRYLNWKLGSVEEVEKTVAFFNGDWNNPRKTIEMSREGWASKWT